MTFKNLDLKHLLLLPPLYISFDFLPLWFIYLYSAGIILISLVRLPLFLAYLNFISVYFIFNTVAKSIIPETMVPMLSVFLFSRILINRKQNNFEIYPVFMWIGSYSIFSSSFYYLSYAIFSLFTIFIIIDNNSTLSLKSLWQNLWSHKKQLSLILLITTLLFFFFPRFHSFLPTANINRQGKVGYSKKINNSTITDLLQSSQIAFYAKLPAKLNPEQLYWRGRVHSSTDGYNWSRGKLPQGSPVKITPGQNKIEYDLKYEQDFDGDVILLDSPTNAKAKGLGLYTIGQTFEYRSYIKKKKAVLTATAILNKKYNTLLSAKQRNIYTTTPNFTPNELSQIILRIEDTKPAAIIETFRQIVLKDKYSYTLSPGSLPTIASFIKAKKGYCSHYSSLMALILRKKGIPARLVSGFQGGRFNDIGGFYEVNSNDAHVWVEYFASGSWKRIDPTGFVAPNRVRLGGNQNGLGAQVERGNANQFMQAYYRAKLFFETLNYRLSSLIDSYDRTTQRNLSKDLKLKLKYFFIIGFSLLAFIFGLYYFLTTRKPKQNLHPADVLLNELLVFLPSTDATVQNFSTLEQINSSLAGYNNQGMLKDFLNLYELARYGRKTDTWPLKLKLEEIKKVKFD